MDTLPKYRRATPEARRDDLIRATLESLAEDGREGASVRKIAARAGVSVGLINHYFDGVDELVAEAYRSLAGSLRQSVSEAVEKAGTDPRARLSAFFRSNFGSPTLDYQVLHVWLAFWSMTRRSPVVQSVHDETYGAYRAMLEDLLSALPTPPNFNRRMAAIGLSALIDGLWLEWCLNQKTFTTDEAVALCESAIENLLRR